VECDKTEVIFQTPKEESTLDYVSGRFGWVPDRLKPVATQTLVSLAWD
jgi:hypothetical protein